MEQVEDVLDVHHSSYHSLEKAVRPGIDAAEVRNLRKEGKEKVDLWVQVYGLT